jgi:CRP-like cAMP-binding protein
MLGPGDFFGEGCLAGQPVRMGTAQAVLTTALLRIPKREMLRMLHPQAPLSNAWTAQVRISWPTGDGWRMLSVRFSQTEIATALDGACSAVLSAVCERARRRSSSLPRRTDVDTTSACSQSSARLRGARCRSR